MSEPPLPVLPDPTFEDGWEQDSTAKREEQFWPEYDEVSKARRNNTIKIHRAIGWCIPIGIIIAFAAFVLLSGIYVLHLVGAQWMRWLAPAEIDKLHTMLFSGIVGAAITQAARIYLGKKD